MELTKSLKAYLYDKTASPLYGNFIISWSLWNWKLFYITFFLSEGVVGNRLDYIYQQNIFGWWVSLVFPVVSTILLITAVPWLANRAKLITLHYEKWMRQKSNRLERKIRLTIEESNALRLEVELERVKFSQTMSSRDNELTVQKELNNSLVENLEQFKNREKGLRVLRAEFGVEGAFIDVTERLNSMIMDNGLELKADISVLGDPKPGAAKVLTVIYVKDGKYEYVMRTETDPKLLILNSAMENAMAEMQKRKDRTKS